ncbi:MAG TPA: DEAD/DEAH box helicase [Methanoculleus sp.]|nr:DEAD/DEAH box helicase [Methanoculleus sp.]
MPIGGVEAACAALLRDPRHAGRIAHVEKISASPPEYRPPAAALPAAVARHLEERGIFLYAHQSAAIDAIARGDNVILTAPTASGKTLAFAIPAFMLLENDPDARVLFLYPTKALAQDQLGTIRAMEEATGITAHPRVYDGDTPQHLRRGIRERSRIILSNPHELHHVMGWHSQWQAFWSSLKLVVIDEAHWYRGITGAHVALLLRRLRRVAGRYGSSPQVLSATATIGNPGEFAEVLTGLPCLPVTGGGGGRPAREFLFYNPSAGTSPAALFGSAAALVEHFMNAGHQTICFTDSRQGSEALVQALCRRLPHERQNEVAAYRAGYLPAARRALEGQLKSGSLRGVVATSALEVGIDIGHLDAVLLAGFPGTRMATWQRAGRAGRGDGASAAVLLAGEDPLDQYYMRHPAAFFAGGVEDAVVDAQNPYVMAGHLICAAAEMPLGEDEARDCFGEGAPALLAALATGGLLTATARGFVYSGTGRAAEMVPFGGTGHTTYRLLCDGTTLETMTEDQAFREAHPGAVFLHHGKTYLIEELDTLTGTITARRSDADMQTRALVTSFPDAIAAERVAPMPWGSLSFGPATITESVPAYRVTRYGDLLGTRPLSLPDRTFDTRALLLTFSEETMDRAKHQGVDAAGALHALEHALIAMMPAHVLCDRWDLGGISSVQFPGTGNPAVLIYDGYAGGAGLAGKAFDRFAALAHSTEAMIRECPCDEGCPSCIYSPKCGSGNTPLDKNGARALLEYITGKGAA